MAAIGHIYRLFRVIHEDLHDAGGHRLQKLDAADAHHLEDGGRVVDGVAEHAQIQDILLLRRRRRLQHLELRRHEERLQQRLLVLHRQLAKVLQKTHHHGETAVEMQNGAARGGNRRVLRLSGRERRL